jgi:hypothetical protein
MCHKLLGHFCALALSAGASRAATINFDIDAFGSPITPPPNFLATVPLTTLYSPIGVTFSGPAALSGDAILNDLGAFGVSARSGTNFLAFNGDALYQSGGLASDPETVTFSTLMSNVSIWASGGGNSATFVMNAFDASNALVGSNTINPAASTYGQLLVSYAPGISYVTLTESNGDGSFVYDDLGFTQVPEPASAVLAVLSILAGGRRRR